MKRLLLTIGLALGVSAFTATAQQGTGKGAQQRERAQVRQQAGDCSNNGQCQLGRGGQRRGQGMGQGNGMRARQGQRDGTGPRSQDGTCIQKAPKQTQ